MISEASRRSSLAVRVGLVLTVAGSVAAPPSLAHPSPHVSPVDSPRACGLAEDAKAAQDAPPGPPAQPAPPAPPAPPVPRVAQEPAAEAPLPKAAAASATAGAAEDPVRTAASRACARIAVSRAESEDPKDVSGKTGSRHRLDLISGFLFDAQGYLLTAGGPLHDAASVTVDLPGQRPSLAEVVGYDPQSGVGVLKIAPIEGLEPPAFAREEVEVGTPVAAFGHPFDLGQTFSAGHVTGRKRNIQPGEFVWRDLLQVSLPVRPGDQGGPVFTIDGTVVAMLVTGLTVPDEGGVQRPVEGISFAVPIDEALATARVILQFRHETAAEGAMRPWFGVRAYDLQDPILRHHLRLEEGLGIIVEETFRDSPALAAGLQPFDVLVEIGGRPVYGTKGFGEIVRELEPQERVELRIVRAGEPKTLELVVGGR